ncbi:hypothetical protein [Galbibacter sp. PAP.153]|uniref:hypothetical protein n=1 Tax=Galbibacter sp. PAP.153 TaxID=3104623 RepID=UPI00300A78EF
MAKKYKIIRKTHMYSTEKLMVLVEEELKKITSEGWEVVSVSFSFCGMWIPAAFITICKEV